MKATLITGASSGIGEAFARRLASEGHNLVLVARREKKLAEICDHLMADHNILAHYVAIDLNEYQADLRLFKETNHHQIEIDWLINNAGFGSMGDFSELNIENELEMISLNVMALTALTHRYLQQMRERESGTIINVSSTAGVQPIPFMATYAATKAFVTSFTEAIAEENRPYGIRVMALCPGATETNFFAASNIKDPVKIKGTQTAEEVVEAALNGLEKGKSKVISGWVNSLVAHAASLAPNSLVTKSIAGKLRPKIEKERATGDLNKDEYEED
jgi:short-subunit dehydrogenase